MYSRKVTQVKNVDPLIAYTKNFKMPPPFLRMPTQMPIVTDAHMKWCILLNKAQLVVSDDMAQQKRAAHGVCLKSRRSPPEAIGRMYAEYCTLINKLYDAYLNSVHLQRAPYMLELVSVFLKRVYELRHELELIIVNDYIYIDGALQQLHMTPFDIQIVVPYHLPLESRPGSIEQLLQDMWADAYRRKYAPAPEPSDSELNEFDDLEFKPSFAKPVIVKEESVHEVVNHEYLNATMIQRHERFRRWHLVQHKKIHNKRKTFFASEPKPMEIRIRAAELIRRIHREFMRIKRMRHRNAIVDVMLGMIPNPFLHRMSFEEERNKMYEKRMQDRDRIREGYMIEKERENTRLLMLRKEDQIDDITDEIYAWFREWYEGYDFFPQYPYELEGGTLAVVRGEYPTIEEKIEEDERILKATKGKTKEQIKQEKARVLADEAKAARAEREVARKDAEALFKARMNPRTDPGYTARQSDVKDDIANILAAYRASWSLYDKRFDARDPHFVYGYIVSMLSEELMTQIHVDCRKYVDELRRLDLKLLNKAQKKMFKLEEKPWPKVKPRKKPRKPPRVKVFNVDETLMKNIEDVFDLDLVSKPTRKLKDIWGDMNYAAYDYSILDPNVEFKPADYGDVKRRLLLSCAFGTGIAPGAKRTKALLLFGPERNGKSFLVDCVAGEINAVKIDISPEKFSAVSAKPAKLMTQVLAAARAFQPAVIFLKNIERVFAKKVLPQDKYLKAKIMDPLLTKLIKSMQENDKIIFIATCSLPLTAKPGMMRLFHESLLVPITDYGSLSYFFYHKLQAIRSMPRDYNVQSIAKVLVGYGFGVIFELFEKIMTPERIIHLNIKRLDGMEFLEPLLDSGLEPVTQEDFKVYVDFYLQHSHLRRPRIEYDIINASRAVAYEKIAKNKKEKENKKAAAT